MTKKRLCWLTCALFLLFAQACSGSGEDSAAADSLHKDKQDKGKTMSKLAAMKTPVFWAEGHPGRLDRENWTIEVTGACTKPRSFTWEDLNALPQKEVQGRLTSVTRWSVGGLWKGVALSTILDEVGMKPSCKYIRFWSVGMIYDTSIPLETALREKSLLAHSFDGEYLTEDYGGPVRAFIPYLWGYKSAKSVVKIELNEKYVSGYWEKRGYTDSGEIEPGRCRDINAGGEVKLIPGGDEVQF
ncbi:MAG TPA: molybdopterin-dependent oxidoreductase [Candidatus Syntrophosphaera sp.]|nr:molybdopterin-dependent oxidoreductase [Candidatus Syntrophosphaera sp.]